MEPRFLVFPSFAALLTIPPGADTALIVGSTLSRGRHTAVRTTFGICTGCLIHSIASALGLSILLNGSAALFEIVKLAGALDLGWLGFQSAIPILMGLVWLIAFTMFLSRMIDGVT